MTPSRRSSGVSFEIRNSAPRILKDPVSCIDSSFIHTGAPTILDNPCENSSGVRRTRPRRNSAASSISAARLSAVVLLIKIYRRLRQNRSDLRDRFEFHPFDRRMRAGAGRSDDYGFDTG